MKRVLWSQVLLWMVLLVSCADPPGATSSTSAPPRTRIIRVSGGANPPPLEQVASAEEPLDQRVSMHSGSSLRRAAPANTEPTEAALLLRPPTKPDKADLLLPPLFSAEGALLEQTDERPTSSSPFFRALGPGLFEAIKKQDTKAAARWFFPLPAYEVAKDSKSPKRDYQHRLMRALTRDIKRHHKRLGRSPERAEFLSFELPEDAIHYKKAGSEYNKLGYWRVLGSQLHFRDASGHRRSLDVTCMIAWRGEWYLIHLDGMR